MGSVAFDQITARLTCGTSRRQQTRDSNVVRQNCSVACSSAGTRFAWQLESPTLEPNPGREEMETFPSEGAQPLTYGACASSNGEQIWQEVSPTLYACPRGNVVLCLETRGSSGKCKQCKWLCCWVCHGLYKSQPLALA